MFGELRLEPLLLLLPAAVSSPPSRQAAALGVVEHTPTTINPPNSFLRKLDPALGELDPLDELVVGRLATANELGTVT